jgi:transcription elongation GreA/GreB family factor
VHAGRYRLAADMPPKVDKGALIAALHARLAARYDALVASQKSAQAGATHGESKQEHAKDMRAVEQQYLARGLAERAETLRDGVAALAALAARDFADDESVRAGALVGLVDDDDRELVYLLAPAGGGETIDAGDTTITVVTPQSPLGASLLRAHVGDELQIEIGAKRRSVVVEWLR